MNSPARVREGGTEGRKGGAAVGKRGADPSTSLSPSVGTMGLNGSPAAPPASVGEGASAQLVGRHCAGPGPHPAVASLVFFNWGKFTPGRWGLPSAQGSVAAHSQGSGTVPHPVHVSTARLGTHSVCHSLMFTVQNTGGYTEAADQRPEEHSDSCRGWCGPASSSPGHTHTGRAGASQGQAPHQGSFHPEPRATS